MAISLQGPIAACSVFLGLVLCDPAFADDSCDYGTEANHRIVSVYGTHPLMLEPTAASEPVGNVPGSLALGTKLNIEINSSNRVEVICEYQTWAKVRVLDIGSGQINGWVPAEYLGKLDYR